MDEIKQPAEGPYAPYRLTMMTEKSCSHLPLVTLFPRKILTVCRKQYLRFVFIVGSSPEE
jgi:hypothetical protein